MDLRESDRNPDRVKEVNCMVSDEEDFEEDEEDEEEEEED